MGHHAVGLALLCLHWRVVVGKGGLRTHFETATVTTGTCRKRPENHLKDGTPPGRIGSVPFRRETRRKLTQRREGFLGHVPRIRRRRCCPPPLQGRAGDANGSGCISHGEPPY